LPSRYKGGGAGVDVLREGKPSRYEGGAVGVDVIREGQALALRRRWGGCGSGKFTLTSAFAPSTGSGLWRTGLPSLVKGEGTAQYAAGKPAG